MLRQSVSTKRCTIFSKHLVYTISSIFSPMVVHNSVLLSLYTIVPNHIRIHSAKKHDILFVLARIHKECFIPVFLCRRWILWRRCVAINENNSLFDIRCIIQRLRHWKFTMFFVAINVHIFLACVYLNMFDKRSLNSVEYNSFY